MSRKMLRSFVSCSIAAIALGAAAMLPMAAQSATWTGGASGTLNDVSNWDGDISTSNMNFTNNCTVSLNADLDVYSVFGSSSGWNWWQKNIVFDLGGYTLRSTCRDSQGRQNFLYNSGCTFTFQHGAFLCVSASSATNSITMASAYRDGNKMTIAVTGADTTFVGSFQNRCTATTGPNNNPSPGNRILVLDGAKAYGVDHYFAGHCSTNEVRSGAALFFDRYCEVGSFGHHYTAYDNSWHGDVMIVEGGTLSARDPASSGTLSVGYGQGARDNAVVARDGATVETRVLYVGAGHSTNNMFLASGAGTTLSVRQSTYIGSADGDGIIDRSSCNSVILENGSKGNFSIDGGALYVCFGGSNHVFAVRSGAMADLGPRNIYLGGRDADNNCGQCGRIEVVGAGSAITNSSDLYVRNKTGSAAKAHEIYVGDGALVKVASLKMIGDGNRVIVSNATMEITDSLFANGFNGAYATNSTFRIEGANARLTANAAKNGANPGVDGQLVGEVVFDFVVPESGWAAAPVAINQSFTIGADTVLRIDEDSVRAFAKANRGGTVPLFSTGASGGAITIADETSLAANLPEGCRLVNGNGVLSLKVAANAGFMMIVW